MKGFNVKKYAKLLRQYDTIHQELQKMRLDYQEMCGIDYDKFHKRYSAHIAELNKTIQENTIPGESLLKG